jgi:hypothetical protein
MSITLETILDKENVYYEDFTSYLQNTYCYENLQFWQAAQNYRENPTPDHYKNIIVNYIEPNSPLEINIPCDMREEILLKAQPHPYIFDEAAEAVLELLRVNSFLPWSSFLYPASRHSLSPSFSFPRLYFHNNTRPSFSSLRDFYHDSNKVSRFQKQKQAVMVHVKRLGSGFSWLAKK